LKGSTLRSLLVALCLVTATSGTTVQMPAGSSASQTVKPDSMGVRRGGANTTFADAIKDSRFTLQKAEGNKDEYKLERTIDAVSTSTSDNLKIDYQVGTIDDKPAFVSLIVDRNKAPKGDVLKGNELRKVEETLGVTARVTVQVGHAEQRVVLQGCNDGKRCVKTDKDGNCIKWVCER